MKYLSRYLPRTTLLVGAMMCSFVSPINAQVRPGSMIVEVRDQTGGAIPGATVTITQAQTNLTRNGITNDVGLITFASVPPGTYSVRVTLEGFKEFVAQAVRVSEDAAVRVN